MKRKSDYILRTVAGKHVIVPTGDEAFKFEGIININETGSLLWEALEKDITEKELIAVMRAEYDVDEQTAAADIHTFISTLSQAGLIE